MKGKTLVVNVTKLAAKLPMNENIWIKYSFDEKTIDGINQGKPVNIFALKYSNNERKIIIYIIENVLFLQSNLAQTQAKPQKNAKRLGKIAIASIIAEKLNMYLIRVFLLLSFFDLFSTHDQRRAIYSREKIVNEKYSKYLKKIAYFK